MARAPSGWPRSPTRSIALIACMTWSTTALRGRCSVCAIAFGVAAAVQAAGVPLLDEYARHPSVRRLISDGIQVLIC